MLRWIGLLLMWCWAAGVAAEPYVLKYEVTPAADFKALNVSIEVPAGRPLRSLVFNTRNHSMVNPSGDGRLERGADSVSWRPPKAGGRLAYQVVVDRERKGGGFDARLTPEWLLMRADRLVPPARVRRAKGIETRAELSFKLPSGWTQVHMAAPKAEPTRFLLTDPGRTLVRPKGWLTAGGLASRTEQFGDTKVIVAGPVGQGLQPLEKLTFLALVWPSLQQALGNIPDMIMITGAQDPFWRGGLSGPRSLYIHNDRPLVGEDGTSTLLHELIHVITGIHGGPKADWIAEGLAEYYAVELLHRAGGLSDARRARIFAQLAAKGATAPRLDVERSSGPVNARAAALFAQLAAELDQCQARGLDVLMRELPEPGAVTLEHLQAGVERLCQRPSQVLRQNFPADRGTQPAGAES